MSLAPHRFTLRQLQYVIAVAEELSFRRAAKRCGVSQPSLSAQLAQLEDAIGVRLFERRGKPVVPTSAGRDLVERARKLVLDADDLEAAAKQASDPLSGTLRIGVIPTISPYLLPHVAPAIRRRFARLSVAWLEDKTEVLVSKLADGALDGAILALEADVGDLARAVIARDPFVLAAPAHHPLAKRRSAASAAELAGERVLLLDEGHCFRNQALEVCGTRAIESEFRATSLSTLVQMVAGGAGVTLLPSLAVDAEAKRARLAVRPMSGAHRTIAMVWRRGSPVAAALEPLTAAIRDVYPK